MYMKKLLMAALILVSVTLNAQRPATKAEHDEDARVLKVLADAMPRDLENADMSERSYGSSNLSGTSGFHNDENFATRDIFEHQYTVSFEFAKAIPQLKEKIDRARAANDIKYLAGASICEIEFWVNASLTKDAMPYALSSLKKISTSYCSQAYRTEGEDEFTFLFFGNNWTVNSYSFNGEDNNGKPQKRYSLNTVLKNHPGTAIQSIMVYVKGHHDLADIILQQIDWKKISSLLGTGQIKDDESESDLKKYFAEKPISPVAGNNTLSFTYLDKDGKEQLFSVSSSGHDLSNCALLRNHNENPKVMGEAHIDFRITDDKNRNRLFHLSLPIIRTTGTVTATFQSDYDYDVMWRGNTDADHSFSPQTIEIQLTKWTPVGGFLEGTFSGTATISDHNDFSADKPVYTIRNGKFRIRRIADEMR